MRDTKPQFTRKPETLLKFQKRDGSRHAQDRQHSKRPRPEARSGRWHQSLGIMPTIHACKRCLPGNTEGRCVSAGRLGKNCSFLLRWRFDEMTCQDQIPLPLLQSAQKSPMHREHSEHRRIVSKGTKMGLGVHERYCWTSRFVVRPESRWTCWSGFCNSEPP